MSRPDELKEHAIQFYSTAPYPCSYLTNQHARSLVAAPSQRISGPLYEQLMQQGFRRSGGFTYRPMCERCQACLPIRIDTARFQANRTQRRILKRLQHLRTQQLPLCWHDEHFELYYRYQQARHEPLPFLEAEQQYRQFLLTSHVDSCLVEFRNPAGQLEMVAVMDLVVSGASAVYTFYNPHSKAILGTYAILWQIEFCRALQQPWLYLGYWIEESRKMQYKTQFQPYQLYDQGQWHSPAP